MNYDIGVFVCNSPHLWIMILVYLSVIQP